MDAARIEVLLFGPLAASVGRGKLELALPNGARVSDALTALSQLYAGSEGRLERIATAVNEEYVARDHVLQAGDRLALIPPVSGG